MNGTTTTPPTRRGLHFSESKGTPAKATQLRRLEFSSTAELELFIKWTKEACKMHWDAAHQSILEDPDWIEYDHLVENLEKIVK